MKIKSIKTINTKKPTESPVVNYIDTDSLYINFGIILESIGLMYNNYSDECVKNFIIYNTLSDNNTLNIPTDFNLDKMEDSEKEVIVNRLKHLEDKEVSCQSLQNLVSNVINDSMIDLMKVNLNCKINKISFKREAVAVRGLFLEKKRYVLWALNNEGVELPEKKRLKVTGIDIIRSTTPKFVKEKMRDVIIDILKYVDYDKTIAKLRKIHEDYFEAEPEEITFIKSANGIIKYMDKFKEDGKFKSTPQHIRGSILYNKFLESHVELRQKYDKIYDGDKVSILYTKKGPNWDADVFAFKDKWLKECKFEEYIDRRRQFEVTMLSPIGKFFDALGWQLPDFENSDMSGLFDW
jgi:hypothetical protein